MSKKIIPGYKDESGSYVKEPTPPAPISNSDPKISDISLDDLLDKHLLILFRETKNLLMESSSGKLNKDNSQCMRDNIKLLIELKKKEKELLDALSDEDLERLTK